MSLSAAQKARALIAQGNNAEAVALLSEAARKNPGDERLWQELALAASHGPEHGQAVHHCREAVKHHPKSDWLWRQLAHVLISGSRLDEAEAALDVAWRLNPDAPFLWRYRADLYRAREDTTEEIAALEYLRTQRSPNPDDLIRLGNLYFNSKRDFGRAIQLYCQAATVAPSAVAYYKLGLAFSNPEVSQDLDAADAYRRSLDIQSDYALAKQQLDATATKLRPLAQRAREQADGLVSADQHFQFYINPIELLQLDSTIDGDPEAAKKIQRATKRLLHEIELNDGIVRWMDNLAIDKSRALSIADELNDDDRRCFHAIVHRNESLRRFLCYGDIQHFLYSDAEPLPEEAWKALDENTSKFREFLSKAFSRQYDLVLSRAIDQRKLAVIEVLFDGRRWVAPENDDLCFRGAMQRVRDALQAAENRKVTDCKPSVQELQSWLDSRALVELFNLLPPAYFREEQIRLVAAIREMAVDCWNKHADPELSAALLNLCQQFKFKSTELNRHLEEDSTALRQILNETREHSFSAEVRRGVPASITSAGAECNGVRLAPGEIEAIRWGEFVQTVNGIESQHDFTIVIRGRSRTVEIQWGKRGILRTIGEAFQKRPDTCPIDELRTADQEEMFQKAINAALHFLVPALLSRLVERLRCGGSVTIGQCRLTADGVAFHTGFFRATNRLVPWSQAVAVIYSGQVAVADRRDRKATTTMSLLETDNATLTLQKFPVDRQAALRSRSRMATMASRTV